MRTKDIVVLPYQKEWKEDFQAIARELQIALGELALSIEHVGSTSVEGLAAKPIIDIDVVIARESFSQVKKSLAAISYSHEGNLGIEDREAFSYSGKDHLRTHHLYVCPSDSKELQRHLAFRNYLRQHPERVSAYGAVKLKAAQLFPNDIDRYMEYKSSIIAEMYKELGEMSEKNAVCDITIIGGGPVGLFAAFYAGLRGMSVKIIESLSELGGQPAVLYPEKLIYDIPAFPAIPAGELVERLVEQLERFEDRVTICMKEEVLGFEKTGEHFTIETSKGEHLSKSIIIACGNGAFAPRTLGLEGEENYADNNLFYNVHKLDQFAGKDVVICGGGDSAVDWANHLEPIAKSVTLVHRRDAFRAHEHSVELLKQSKVNVLTPYIPLELKGDGEFAKSLLIQKVKSDETIELPLDALIVSFGFSTSNKNLKNWNIDYKRSSILVNSLLETSQAGVYAIGDAAEYDGKLALIATGFGEAPLAVNQAIKYIYPERDSRAVHSTSLVKED